MARIASRHGNPDSRARMKIELGPTVQVLANLGVIAGIAVLALELKQNNELLASQARSNLDANRVAQHPGLQDHWASLKATLDPDFVHFMEERVLALMGSIPRPQ
jgi:hypothetical protein